MNRPLSQYLDLMRLIAASLVLYAHMSHPTIGGGAVWAPSEIGHGAVMAFFVLSGYVISYVAVEREVTLVDFVISRLARVYSVVLPALALTIFVDILFMNISPRFNTVAFLSGMPDYQYHQFLKYFLMNILFANQLWDLREPAFSNGVYWSMCFEVYYYVIFSIVFYFKGKWQLILLALFLLIMGPVPLLYFHLWLFGCGIYFLHQKYQISLGVARIVYVGTLALLALDLATNLVLRIDDQLDLLSNGWVSHGFAHRVAGDTLTGLLVAMNIFAARDARLSFGPIGWWFTYLASFSFSLYLMHVPLSRFWVAYWDPGPIATVTMVLVCVWLIGQVTEKQKNNLRNALRGVLIAHPRWAGRSNT